MKDLEEESTLRWLSMEILNLINDPQNEELLDRVEALAKKHAPGPKNPLFIVGTFPQSVELKNCTIHGEITITGDNIQVHVTNCQIITNNGQPCAVQINQKTTP